jgi:hypothetical protein
MDLQLKGKKAIVTGGSAGIGLAVARPLTEEGVEVTIPGRHGKKLSETNRLASWFCPRNRGESWHRGRSQEAHRAGPGDRHPRQQPRHLRIARIGRDDEGNEGDREFSTSRTDSFRGDCWIFCKAEPPYQMQPLSRPAHFAHPANGGRERSGQFGCLSRKPPSLPQQTVQRYDARAASSVQFCKSAADSQRIKQREKEHGISDAE